MEWSKAANDDVRRVAEGFGDNPEDRYDFWCECGCRGRLTTTLRRFDALRRDGQPLLLERHTQRQRAKRALRQQARALRRRSLRRRQ